MVPNLFCDQCQSIVYIITNRHGGLYSPYFALILRRPVYVHWLTIVSYELFKICFVYRSLEFIRRAHNIEYLKYKLHLVSN